MMDVNKEVICKIKIGRSFKFTSANKKKGTGLIYCVKPVYCFHNACRLFERFKDQVNGERIKVKG